MGFSIGKIFKGVVNFGSKVLGGSVGGFLGGGPLGALFGGLSNLTGGLLSKPQSQLPSMQSSIFPSPLGGDQTSGLLGVINRLVSVLSSVVNGLLSKLTGGSPQEQAPVKALSTQQDALSNVA
ncbi:MAG: hypothetical protein AMXMBFR58_30300 [Phycisphaerae bacterium]|nr:hypothetical protein [Phycisphaerales bacterium]MCK6476029.1 hypothetical protein [Phycisphaerales bacterium]